MDPEEFLTEYENTLATQKWEKVSPLIHKKACVVFSIGTSKGKEEVKNVVERNFTLIKNETYSTSNVHRILKTDKFAAFLFNFFWSGVINKKSAEGKERETITIVKEKGKLLLLAEHLGPE